MYHLQLKASFARHPRNLTFNEIVSVRSVENPDGEITLEEAERLVASGQAIDVTAYEEEAEGDAEQEQPEVDPLLQQAPEAPKAKPSKKQK